MKLLHHIGAYFLMLRMVFIKPTKGKVMRKLIFQDIQDLIIGSLEKEFLKYIRITSSNKAKFPVI
ncbi:MAG: hypothetical protein ACPF95_03445, partial [Flavobacteriaceae bacterium]